MYSTANSERAAKGAVTNPNAAYILPETAVPTHDSRRKF